MYQINLGNEILYYPGSEDAAVFDTELNEEVGLAGEFTFKVPPTNPLYSKLATGSLVTILKDGVEYWRGDIRDIKTDFAKIASVYCLEDLSWLGDEYLTPAYIDDETYAQRFQAAISSYNANRSSDKQFTVGFITNVSSSNLCTWKTEYNQSILEDLRNCIAKDTGFLRVRRVTSGGTVTRYIDIVPLSDYGSQATQPIEYGYNLLDYVKESDYGNLTNVLTPYGAELDSTVYDEYNARLQGTTITDNASVTAYGRHAKAVIFDGVDNLTTLNALAAAYLTRYAQPQLTMEVEAVDLAAIENVADIKIGDSVRIIAPPFAVDQWLYLTQIKRDIQNVDKNTITLSGHVQTGRSLTDQAHGTADAVKNLPSKSSILDAARKNAYEILQGVDGGYVTFDTNSDGQITELRIANNLDYSQATKCWRWNLGGLAYLSRASASDDWTVVTAATMDGGLVADFITAGTLSLQHDGALLRALNTSDQTIVQVDENGLYAIRGDIAGFAIDTDGFLKNSGGIYAKYGYTGATIGKLINDTYWARTDYVPDSGYWRIDYGQLGNGGLWVTNAGNNSYYDMGSHYVHVYATDIYSPDKGYAQWSGSDARMKRDINDLKLDESRELLKVLRPRKFQFKSEDGERYGFIAQEVREVIKDDSALEYGGEMRSLHYNDLIAPLVQCVNNLYDKIDELQKQIDKLKGV